MKTVRYLTAFFLLAAISIAAENQDIRHMQSIRKNSHPIRAVFVDSHGVKWFGTSRGLYRFDNTNWSYYSNTNYLAGNEVYALTFEANDGGNALWVATDGGVSVLSFDANGVSASKSYTSEDGLLNNKVIDVAVGPHGAKFFATAGGLNWFHGGKMDTIEYDDYYSYIFDSGIRDLHMYADTLYLAQDGGIGRLVAGVDAVSGASRWDGAYGISPFSTDIRSSLVKGERMQYFATDAGVETHEGYFAKQGWDLISTDQGLVNNEVICMAEDAQGGLWVGTRGGVSHLDMGIWSSYTTADGLINDTVFSIAFDPDGSVWFATAGGVSWLRNGVFRDFIAAVEDQAANTVEFGLFYRADEKALRLTYTLEKNVAVHARLFDNSGSLIACWNDLPSGTGRHEHSLKLKNGCLPGVYILQLSQGNSYSSQKLIIE